MTTDKILDVKEVSQALRVPERTVYALIERGEIACIRVGRRRYVLETVVQDIIDRGRTTPLPTTDEDEI
jgi:excisionase family DNA binding protein